MKNKRFIDLNSNYSLSLLMRQASVSIEFFFVSYFRWKTVLFIQISKSLVFYVLVRFISIISCFRKFLRFFSSYWRRDFVFKLNQIVVFFFLVHFFVSFIFYMIWFTSLLQNFSSIPGLRNFQLYLHFTSTSTSLQENRYIFNFF